MLPRGSFFSIWVFGWGSIHKSPKKWLFQQKVGVYSTKTPKTRLFTLPGALFKSGAALARIRYSYIPTCVKTFLKQKKCHTDGFFLLNECYGWSSIKSQSLFVRKWDSTSIFWMYLIFSVFRALAHPSEMRALSWMKNDSEKCFKCYIFGVQIFRHFFTIFA